MDQSPCCFSISYNRTVDLAKREARPFVFQTWDSSASSSRELVGKKRCYKSCALISHLFLASPGERDLLNATVGLDVSRFR